MKDQLKGVEYLKSLPFVNAEKWEFMVGVSVDL